MAVWSCWILAGIGTRCHTHRFRASEACSLGDMSGEYAGHARTGMFSSSRNCVQILATWSRALLCCNMKWWWRMNGTTMGHRFLSRYLCIKIAINKMNLCSLSVAYGCPYYNPPPPWGTLFTTLVLANCSPTRLPSSVKTGIHPWREHFSKVTDTIKGERLPTQVSYDNELQLTVCAEILWLCKPAVTPAVWVAGLRRSCRCEEAGCGDSGMVWSHRVCGCEAGWMYCQILGNYIGDSLWWWN